MAAQKDTDRPAASAGNITNAALWVIVDALGASVKMTLAQLKTFYNAVTSMSGDVSAVITAGAAVTTIGALKVATGMLQNLAVTTGKIADDAVTFAKMQNIATSRLLGRSTAASGDVEEISLSADLTLTAGVLGLAVTPGTPVVLASDATSGSGNALSNVGIALAIAANTKYFFEFFIIWTSNSTSEGPKFAVSCPASPTSIMYTIELDPDPAINTATRRTETVQASDGGTGVTSCVSNTSLHHAKISGVIRNGANAGNLQLRHSNTNSTTTITTKAGSFGRLVTLP